MIEASAALSNLAAVAPPPPTPVETQVRAPVADQPTVGRDASSPISDLRYFRFNLKYDTSSQQLYVVFKNQYTGDVVDETLNSNPVRISSGRASVSQEVAASPAPAAGTGAPRPQSVAAASPAPAAPGVSAAPVAPGAGSGSGSDTARGGAIDTRT